MSITLVETGRWYLDIRFQKKGKTYRRREEFSGTRRAAEIRKTEILKDLLREADHDSGSLTFTTFAEVLDYYSERHNIDPDSLCYFKRLKEDLGKVNMAEFQGRFDRYFLLLKQGRSQRTGRPYAPQTLNHFIKWAQTVINFSLNNGLLDKNPINWKYKMNNTQ